MRYAWKITLFHLKSPLHAFLKSCGGWGNTSEVSATLKEVGQSEAEDLTQMLEAECVHLKLLIAPPSSHNSIFISY